MDQQKEVGREQGVRICKMVICRIYDVPLSEQGPLLGTTQKTVEKWRTRYRDEITELLAFSRALLPKPAIGDEVKMDEKSFKDALRARFNAQLQVLDRALQSYDVRTAMSAASEMNKILGLTTKTTVENKGTIVHEHKIVPAGLRAIDGPRLRRGQPPLIDVTPQVDDGTNG